MSTAQITSRELANAIRFLAIDAVEKSKSGHPGAPMGMADIAEVLWRHHLNHNPADPHWINRDRFVLSNGHGSMLIYALLHLTGYPVSIEDIKNFRQLHSITAGHPEVDITPGVETTTGPLGQGLANAVGMALAESLLAKRFNRPGHTIIDHHTYTFLGDGCLMEGISHEVCSLAGVWGLNKLICFYDDNGISIDGHVDGWFKDDTASRFKAYGWNVIGPIDGHDAQAVNAATTAAQSETAKPTLIICKTTIGWGAPNMAGTHDVHGAPLGEKEAAATREALGWKYGPFEIPAPIKTAWDAVESGKAKQAQWNEQLAKYQAAFPELAKELMRCATEKLPATWSSTKTQLFASMKAIEAPTASRKSSQQTLDILVPALPELLGGSADLTGSNLTAAKTSVTWHHKTDQAANYISYGVREFGMSAIMNGVALHKGFIPYGGTFAVFSDYARNAIRMSALMKQRVIYVLTHDSIGLGEDGPTHQPIEHAASLRLIPHLDLWRPCDGFETAIAWTAAIERTDGPSALFLSRQNLPQLSKNISEADVMRGGYVLSDCEGKPDAVLIATGSEVGLAMQAQEILRTQGKSVRVVSMPCTSLFDRQDKSWQEKVLPSGIKRIAIEAGHPDLWWKYVGLDGAVVGINRFGESAPAAAVYKALGVTVERIVELV
ncbi:MAG: transketolase [Burkholderiaceae bacterium]|nr:transketolase [Burkholderiaceae bacterium]